MFSFFLRFKLVETNLLQFIKFLSRTQSLFSKAKIGSCRREPSDYTMCTANQACISTHRQFIYTGQCNRRRTNALSHHICRTAPGRAKAATKPGIKNQQGKPALLTSFAHHSGQYPREHSLFALFIARRRSYAHGTWRRCFRTLGETSQYPPAKSHPPPSYAHPGSAPHIPE